MTKSMVANDAEIIREPFDPKWEFNTYFSKECQEHFEYLSQIIENLLDIIIVTDRRGLMRFISASAQNILGYDPKKHFGRNPLEFIHHDDRESAKNNFYMGLEHCQWERIEFRFKHSNGHYVWLDAQGYPFRDTRGNMLGISFCGRDVTRYKQLEKNLAEGKERLGVTLNSIGEGVIAADEDGRIILMNQIAEEITGWTYGETVNRSLDEVFFLLEPSTTRARSRLVQIVMRADVPVVLNNHRLIRKDGSATIVTVTGNAIHDQQGKSMGVVIVARDTNAELKIEEEMIRASKLESLEVLAGGIAHDFNNLMTVVMGNVTLTRMLLSEEHEAGPMLAEAEKATCQARHLTHQLLTFARGGKPVKTMLSLFPIVKEAAGFALSGSNVRAEITCEEGLWLIEADEGGMNQVFSNLFINAMQAMPDGGTIQVKIENFTQENQEPALQLLMEYVRVTIQDSGVGIPRENQTKIFDPYFSTRAAGNGLGLATAYSIIKNHEGFIDVNSTPGQGTIFEIFIPAATGQKIED
ncbi:MAG: PAS domain S-box protein [Syntrophomonadaceae bacterium]|nr:PAS domain S-box protein [Syntrophomonadaceae bacterium]